MKIGIYGDSYTTPHGPFNVPTNWYNRLVWLIKHDTHSDLGYSEPILTHYGLGGSSLYYSYRKFTETAYLNDLNIFLVTSLNRFPTCLPLSIHGGRDWPFTCESQVHSFKETWKDELSENDNLRLDDLAAWFRVVDGQYNIDMAELILDKLESMNTNTIFYPCFSDSFSDNRYKKHKLDKTLNHMHSMWIRQLDLFDINPDNFNAMETDKLCGHLVPEFNLFFANMMFKRIKTGKWDNSGFFDVKIDGPRKLYYNNYNHE